MIRLFLIALALCVTLPGLAVAQQSQQFPALFNVVSVDRGDVLNIRAAPTASAPRVGALPPDARNVEVVRSQGGWGLVNNGEVAGWVSMAYLARVPDQGGDYILSRKLHCAGTEPFWSLVITQGDTALFRGAGLPNRGFRVGLLQRAAGHSGRFSIRGANNGTGASMAAVIARQACNDGMSDREFGLSVDLLLDDAHLVGCCQIDRN